ncbi:MAG: DUF3500 domain-containing protein [Actinomycetota bacterium]|nr:DUF3500 domain-containing protein [Actinomycetota bacterium]
MRPRPSREHGGSARNMVEACATFLGHLKSPLRDAALFSFEDNERLNWSYLPGSRRGLPLGSMTSGDKNRLEQLLRSGLSEFGATTATAIIEHELILGALESDQGLDSIRRDPALYYLSVFGEPQDRNEWAWRLEGHHLSLHFTLLGDALLATTPSFFGANPARVPTGPHAGLRILAPLEDLARSLMTSFSGRQRERALVADSAPPDIITSTQRRISLGKAEGLPSSAMSSEQRAGLEALIDAYAQRLAEPLRAKTQGAVGPVLFAWAGGSAGGERHYYRIQGESVLIEYDNVQNGANHIHSVWRDTSGDFGIDPLKQHHENHHAQDSGHS